MKQLIVFLLVFESITTFSQTIGPEYSQPFIEVTGTAEKEVVPDEIYIGLRITDKFFTSIESQANKLKIKLTNLGIPVSNLYVTGATSQIIKQKDVKVGVEESRDLKLKVANVSQLTAVFEMLSNLGIEEASVLQVDHSKMDSLRKEVRISAILAAKEKAVYLLAAIGEQIGKPLEIKEDVGSPYFFGRNYLSNTTSPATTSEPSAEASYERVVIRISYTVKYAIK